MGNAISAVLPLALGIALSPIPIIATILLLLSPRARASSVGFAAGWILGILTAIPTPLPAFITSHSASCSSRVRIRCFFWIPVV